LLVVVVRAVEVVDEATGGSGFPSPCRKCSDDLESTFTNTV
jgi:hypothetical protein